MTQADQFSNEAQILLDNVSVVSRDAKGLQEEKRLLWREYLELQLPDGVSFDTAAESLLTCYYGEHQDDSFADAEEKIAMASFMTERYSATVIFDATSISQMIPSDATVVCLDASGFATEVLERLRVTFPRWQTEGVGNYTEVCEIVNRGEADFGILPIESSTDGRLSRFYSMLDKYDLKICAVCDVEDEENESVTRFALVSRSLLVLADQERRLIELSSISSNAAETVKLIAAADRLGISVKRFSSTPLYYRGNTCVDTVTFELSSENELPFLTYLYLFHKDVVVLGFYIQI